MKQKTCPVCELSINENIITCPQCEWDFTDVLGTPEKSGVELQKKLAEARTAWKNRIKTKPVTNLRSHIQGNDILLEWEWSDNADKVQISFHYDYFPRSEKDPTATTSFCTRTEYVRNGYYRLPRYTQKRIHYFNVYAISATGTFSLPAQCKERAGLINEVHYRVVKEKHFFLFHTSAIKIQVKGSAKLGQLKNLILIGNKDRLPLSIEDGAILLNIPNIDLSQNGVDDILVPEEHWNEECFVRLFFRQDKNAEEIHLIHSALEDMRLG